MTCHVHLKIGFILSLSLQFYACASQSEDLTRIFKDNQSNLIQCQVDLTNASRDADLSRGQREVAEQTAEQATQSRLAVEKENQALHKQIVILQEQLTSPASHSILPQHTQNPEIVAQSLSDSDLLKIISLESTGAKALKHGVLAIFGTLKSQVIFNPKNRVISSIAHFSGFHIDLNYVNKWNKEHRFGRLYLDDDEDVVVEAELDLEPGVKVEALRAWVRNYGILINLLNRELIEYERAHRQEKGYQGQKQRTHKM